MRKVFLTLAISFVIFNSSFLIVKAQLQGQAKIDSLLKEIPKMKQDTNAVNLLGALSFEYRLINPVDGVKYGEKGFKIAENINWELGKAKCYNYLGLNYLMRNSNDPKVLEYFIKALKINEEIKNRYWIAINLGNIGLFYSNHSDYHKALEYYHKALKIVEELGNKNGIALHLGNIGIIYQNQSNYTKALEYYHNALKIDEELGNKNGVARHLGNIGVIYQNQIDYPKALEYLLKALEINQDLGNKSEIAINLGNIGELYYSLSQDTVLSKINEGTNLVSLNKAINLNRAIDYTLESINIFEEIGELHTRSNNYKNLAVAYTDKGDYKEAFEAFKEYKTLQDSVFSMDRQKEFANLESKRELELKENENQLLIKNNQLFNAELIQKNQKINLAEKEKALQHLAFLKEKAEKQEREKELSLSETQMKLQKSQIASLDKDKEKQNSELKAKNLQRNFFIAGVIVFIILFLIAFIRFREKKKLSDKLAKQNHEIETQKSIVEEKNQEIISSITYASTIQHAILPWESTIQNAISEYFIFYKPKDIVSGDSYWFQEIDGIKFLAVIDCTGHGIPGAMLTVIASSVLDDAVLSKKLKDTGEILTFMNEKVTEVLNQKLAENKIRDGMEVALIAIHQDKIQFSGAGRPLYLKNRTMEIIKTDKRGIAGQAENDEYEFSSVVIEKNENMSLYLTSDGFADQMNENSKKFSSKRFVALLDSISEKPISEQKEILEYEFNNHKGERNQIDDITILGVRL
jgi:tetratricopeptide (TPR) repeat protein/serine phosphatase RsbU (regulator of sigma subunit)